MKKRYLILAAFLAVALFAVPAHGQQGNMVLQRGAGAPSDPCPNNLRFFINTSNGDFYDCQANSWNKVGPGAAGAVDWDSINSPSAGNQSLTMANFLTDWVWGTATGVSTMFDLRDTTGNTGTGYVLSVSTTGTSAAKPIRITDGGLVNGVEMTTAGVLQAIGTGSILADSLTDTALATLIGNQTIWDSANASRILTFGLSGATDPAVTLADGVFNLTTGTLQQNGDDVIHKDTNTLLSTENVILDGSTNPRDITLGIIRILQTPNIDSTRGIAIITDAAGFGDTKALEIDWTATGVAAGDFEAVIDIDIDTANSSGGIIIGLEITETTTGSAVTYGMLTGVGINPILNEAGIFGNIETAFTFDSVFTDVTADFNSTASDVQMFVSNGDLVYIGMAALFDEVEFILAVTASNAGIQPTFEYSDGASGWITFSPTDNTNGMRQNGDLVWIATALAGWAQDTVNAISGKFWIRITRGAVTVATPPTEDLVQVNADLDFVWDSSGNLNVASVSSGFNTEIADAGFIRCANNEICMASEAATPGADLTLLWDASDILQSNTAFNATTLTEGANAVPNSTDTLAFFTATTSAEFLGVISNETGTTGLVVASINPTLTDVIIDDIVEFVENAGDPACAAGDYRLKGNSSTGKLRGCEDGSLFDLNTTAGSASWSSLTAPTGAVTMDSDANAELVQFNYTSALGATDVAFQIEQLTGNPVAGSILFEVTAADTDILLMSVGAGANTIDVTQAGAMTAEGTASITATDLAANAIDALTEFDPVLCAASQILERQGSVWACIATPSGAAHAILSATHTDTTAATVVRGDLMVGQQVSPVWERLAVGGANDIFGTDGTDPAWEASTGTASPVRANNPLFPDRVRFTAISPPAHSAGQTFYDSDNESLTFHNDEAEIALQVGQETWIRVRNESGSTISNGQVVYIDGSASGLPRIALARADVSTTAEAVGLATHDIETASTGFVTAYGMVRDFDTSAFALADRVFLSASTAGAITNTAPSDPNFVVSIGIVTEVNVSTGDVLVTLGAPRFTGGSGILLDGTTISTLSSEENFLVSGALSCGLNTAGKMQTHTTPLQYCDNAGTPALQFAAYGASDGDALAGATATGFFDTGTIEATRLPSAAAATLGVIELDNALAGTAAAVELAAAVGGDGIVLNTATAPDSLDIDLNATVDGVGSASNLSGMEFTATSELALLQGCADTQILKYTTTGDLWECQNDADSGGAPTLDSVTAAAGTTTINSGDNAIVWNWSLTTASKIAFQFGENVASTATTDPVLIDIATLAASTAHPLEVTARGTANGIRVQATDGIVVALGTGGLDWPALLNYPTGCTNEFVRTIADTLTCNPVGTSDISANAADDTIIRDSAGFSVIGKTATGTGDPADIVAADETVLGRTGAGNLVFAQVATGQVANQAITFAKIQNIATDRLMGRDTAGSGSPEEISLNATLEFTGAGAIQRAALTGDVTASAGSNATLIAAGVVASAELATANKTFKCNFVLFDENGLSDTDDIPTVSNCSIPGRAITINEVRCEYTTGTAPTVQLQKDDGAVTNMLSATLTCGTDVQGTCGTGCTTSFVSTENQMAAEDNLDFLLLTANTSTRISMVITGTID